MVIITEEEKLLKQNKHFKIAWKVSLMHLTFVHNKITLKQLCII